MNYHNTAFGMLARIWGLVSSVRGRHGIAEACVISALKWVMSISMKRP